MTTINSDGGSTTTRNIFTFDMAASDATCKDMYENYLISDVVVGSRT